jgi:hypothetical protein
LVMLDLGGFIHFIPSLCWANLMNSHADIRFLGEISTFDDFVFLDAGRSNSLFLLVQSPICVH